MADSTDGITLVDSSEWKKNEAKPETKSKSKKQPLSRAKLIFYGFLGLLWFLFMRFAHTHGWGQPALIISIIILIFTNLGKRKEGTLSAYSVFNKGTQRLLGTFAHDAIDQQFGGRLIDEDEFEEEKKKREAQNAKLRETRFNAMSKMSNKACYCGSGKKYKKCCYWRELRAREEKYKPKPQNVAPQDISDSDSD